MSVSLPRRSEPSRTAAGSSVEVRGWGWRYAGRKAWACRGVDLHISPGERVLLVGASGAGKSTLLRGVAGLLDPDTAAEQAGEVLLDGVPAVQVRDRVGMLMQDPEASLVMSRAGDDVAFGLENAGVPAAEIWPRVDAAFEQVGFRYGRDRSTSALSGGEQQRLALAGALARRPRCLLLDEPTANLDPGGSAAVLEAVDRVVRTSGATLIIVDHRVDTAVRLVDRVVVLEPGGGVLADGTPDQVYSAGGTALAAAGIWVPAPWRPPLPRQERAVPAGPDLLRGTELARTYPRMPRPAIADATLTLRRGEVTALVGPNGSGKSTLAMLAAGLDRPDHGAVRFVDGAGLPLHLWRARDLCRRVGTVFQDPEHQFVSATVHDELLVGPRRSGVDDTEARRRAEEMLTRLRLDRLAGANPFTLSGGEKRRLSVAAALTTAPDLLVLDEPTFGQDAATWHELVTLCARLRDDGTAILAVTHDEAFVDALADVRREVREGRLA